MDAAQAAMTAFPYAPIDLHNVAFFAGLEARRLLVNRCATCGTWHHPPAGICPYCWGEEVLATEISGRGIVALVVTVRHPVPQAGLFTMGPHVLVTVELNEQRGLRFTAPLNGDEPAPPAPAREVELVWAPVGDVVLPTVRTVCTPRLGQAQA